MFKTPTAPQRTSSHLPNQHTNPLKKTQQNSEPTDTLAALTRAWTTPLEASCLGRHTHIQVNQEAPQKNGKSKQWHTHNTTKPIIQWIIRRMSMLIISPPPPQQKNNLVCYYLLVPLQLNHLRADFVFSGCSRVERWAREMGIWCSSMISILNVYLIGSMGMVYLPTWMVDFYGKCRCIYIYHTWILWVYTFDTSYTTYVCCVLFRNETVSQELWFHTWFLTPWTRFDRLVGPIGCCPSTMVDFAEISRWAPSCPETDQQQ